MTKHTSLKIEVADNGYVVEGSNRRKYIFKNMEELTDWIKDNLSLELFTLDALNGLDYEDSPKEQGYGGYTGIPIAANNYQYYAKTALPNTSPSVSISGISTTSITSQI